MFGTHWQNQIQRLSQRCLHSLTAVLALLSLVLGLIGQSHWVLCVHAQGLIELEPAGVTDGVSCWDKAIDTKALEAIDVAAPSSTRQIGMSDRHAISFQSPCYDVSFGQGGQLALTSPDASSMKRLLDAHNGLVKMLLPWYCQGGAAAFQSLATLLVLQPNPPPWAEDLPQSGLVATKTVRLLI